MDKLTLRANSVPVALLLTLGLVILLCNCAGEGDDDGSGGFINSAPALSTPDGAAGAVVVSGADPTYTGAVAIGGNLALSFQATDSNSGDTLNATISVTGGTITPVQAGFAESFPFSPAGSISPLTVSLSGTAATTGVIELTIVVADGQGGSDQLSLTITINDPPVLPAPDISSGNVRLAGIGPTFVGSIHLGGNLALSFQATDTNPADTLISTIDVTGGSLTAVQAGFNESFPFSPAGSNSPHTISLSGTATTRGSIRLTVSVDDGRGGTDQITLMIRLDGPLLDFNGDGLEDVIIGANRDDDGGTDSGSAFIFLGAITPPSVIDASAADVILVGNDPGDEFGGRASSAGDVNGDGYDDVIVGAWRDDDGGTDSGVAFIFFGSAAPPSTISASSADVILVGRNIGDQFGHGLSSAGDFNGDGYDDVIVGAHLDDGASTNSGAAYVFYGSATLSGVIDASSADVFLLGVAMGDGFGWSASLAGDVNDDGYDDVIVGAWEANDGGMSSGAAYVFLGSATPASTMNASAADLILVGADAFDQFGYSVSSAGDVNGDGYPDVIVGAKWDDDGGNSSGAAFIFFGSATPTGTIDASAADVAIAGADADDLFGYSVSSAGDINGDGYDDVIVGAYLDDDGGAQAGVAFIFFGAAVPAAVIDASAANLKLVGRDPGDFLGYKVSSAGDFNGDGYSDVIVGALLDDDGGTDSGVAFIFLGSAALPGTINASSADVTLVGGDPGDFLGSGLGGG